MCIAKHAELWWWLQGMACTAARSACTQAPWSLTLRKMLATVPSAVGRDSAAGACHATARDDSAWGEQVWHRAEDDAAAARVTWEQALLL